MPTKKKGKTLVFTVIIPKYSIIFPEIVHVLIKICSFSNQ